MNKHFTSKLDQALEIIKSNAKLQTDFFDPNLTDEDYDKFYSSGFWDHILLGKNDILNGFFALRIIPNLPMIDWPIVYNNFSDQMVILTSGFKSLPMLNFKYYYKDANGFENWYKHHEGKIQNQKLVYDALGINEVGELHFNFISNPDNAPSWGRRGKKEYQEAYATHFLKYDSSNEHQQFRKLIGELMNDEEAVSEIPEGNFGIWQSLLYKSIAFRNFCLNYEDKLPLNKLAKTIWLAFLEPHTYGNCSATISQEQKLNDPFSLNNRFARVLNSMKDELPVEIQKHPAIKIVEIMENQGENYNGFEHIEMAAILDTEYNDPKGAWNALINGSYWLARSTKGKNTNELLQSYAKMAKKIGEDLSWKDAVIALERNIKRYDNIT